MIEGVQVKQLKVIADERGYLMELLRSDDLLFEEFGQAYIIVAYPGIVKAWHYHKKQDDFFVCIKGMAKIVLYDNRKESKTYKEINEFFAGEKNNVLIKIPKKVVHGFKAIGNKEAMIINFPNKLYNYKKPDEFRLPYNSKKIPYDWETKFG
ncbi:MAG: dTDP-4-dehydrorhamnose 3,5-epimerase family protein [Candidatus Diapherotrites archaeon]